MYKRCRFFIPHGLKDIEGILREAGGVNLTEVTILGLVWCRLADIVKSCPDKLAQGIFSVSVIGNAGVVSLSAPSGDGVTESRTVLVGIG